MEFQPTEQPAGTSAKLREVKGQAQDSLAHDANVHVTCLSGVENGKRNIALNVLERLAAALGITEERLVRR